MNTQIGVWIFIPIIMGIALIPIPSSFLTKFLIVFLTLSYSIIFGSIRYAFFMHTLLNFSYIFSAPLYFIFGPFIDFSYVVGTYSFYVGIIAKKLQKTEEAWKWIY
jgi:hypothetical protein